MAIQDIDLRLLRVFRAVVEAEGFSNAQRILNSSQSTISTQMSQLEQRLGYRLCERGRSGFRLTGEGEVFYGYVIDFFQSINAFQQRTRSLRHRLDGELRIGFLDNVVTDANNPLQAALDRFMSTPDNRVHVAFESLAPDELEQRVLDHRLDVALGIFNNRLPRLHYEPLYTERDILVCSPEHEFAGFGDALKLAECIRTMPHVTRSFLGADEFPFDDSLSEQPSSNVISVEASVMLILTGHYIGFLPEHYARAWLERGELVSLFPDRFFRHSTFHAITAVGETHPSSALQTFMDCLHDTRSSLEISPHASAVSM